MNDQGGTLKRGGVRADAQTAQRARDAKREYEATEAKLANLAAEDPKAAYVELHGIMTRHIVRLLRAEQRAGAKPSRDVTDRLREYDSSPMRCRPTGGRRAPTMTLIGSSKTCHDAWSSRPSDSPQRSVRCRSSLPTSSTESSGRTITNSRASATSLRPTSLRSSPCSKRDFHVTS